MVTQCEARPSRSSMKFVDQTHRHASGKCSMTATAEANSRVSDLTLSSSKYGGINIWCPWGNICEAKAWTVNADAGHPWDARVLDFGIKGDAKNAHTFSMCKTPQRQ